MIQIFSFRWASPFMNFHFLWPSTIHIKCLLRQYEQSIWAICPTGIAKWNKFEPICHQYSVDATSMTMWGQQPPELICQDIVIFLTFYVMFKIKAFECSVLNVLCVSSLNIFIYAHLWYWES